MDGLTRSIPRERADFEQWSFSWYVGLEGQDRGAKIFKNRGLLDGSYRQLTLYKFSTFRKIYIFGQQIEFHHGIYNLF